MITGTAITEKGKTMRLIDADALIEDIKSFWDWDSIDGITSTTVLKQTITDISHAPTIDAVPVEVVADIFGEVPCNYAFCAIHGDGFIQVGDFMYEQCDGWCEDKCGEVPTIECWKRFFKAWVERKYDE